MDEMNLEAFPKIRFAHKYTANTYGPNFIKHDKVVEITAIIEGELLVWAENTQAVAQTGDIVFRYQTDLQVHAPSKHTHHTVCFFLGQELSNQQWHFPTVIHSPKNFSDLLRLIDQIIQTQHLDANNQLKISGLLLQLLGELQNTQKDSGNCQTPSDTHYVTQAKNYIYEHISEPILQKDIAKHLGITPEYLCNIFKKSEGRPIIRYINEIKLNAVRTMMENAQIPLNQAAQQYGFTDPNYVSKLYKKYYRQSITYAIKTLKKYS